MAGGQNRREQTDTGVIVDGRRLAERRVRIRIAVRRYRAQVQIGVEVKVVHDVVDDVQHICRENHT